MKLVDGYGLTMTPKISTRVSVRGGYAKQWNRVTTKPTNVLEEVLLYKVSNRYPHFVNMCLFLSLFYAQFSQLCLNCYHILLSNLIAQGPPPPPQPASSSASSSSPRLPDQSINSDAKCRIPHIGTLQKRSVASYRPKHHHMKPGRRILKAQPLYLQRSN